MFIHPKTTTDMQNPMKFTLRFTLFLSLFALLMPTFGWAAPEADQWPRGPRWERLGSRKVTYRADRDVIRVTAQEGTFRALKLEVDRAPIDLNHVVIHYRNGDTQSIRLRQRIPRGGSSPILDLPGNRRIITKVVLYYDTKVLARRRATVHLWGRK
jgi:hypothetical protein